MKEKNVESRYIVYAVMVFAMIFSVLPGCSKNGEQKAVYVKKAVLVEVAEVERGEILRTLDYKGTVSPWRRANIAPDTSGRVRKIYKKQGDRVKKGELLAELDATTLKLQIKQAQAALDVAVAAFNDAQLNYSRLEKLFQKTAISKLQLEKARLGLESAQTQKKSAQATLDVIRHTMGNAYMRAPFAGIITSKNSEEGDVINPMMGMGASVLTLMDLESVKVIIDVPSEDIEKISVDQPCTVRVATLGDESLEGRVYSKNLAADPVSKTFKVEIKLDNPGLRIKSGIFAEVSIEVSRKANCLRLPVSALNDGDVAPFVVLYDNGKAKIKQIRVGERNDEFFEISEGLSAGQLVVVKGNYDLKDGALITYEKK